MKSVLRALLLVAVCQCLLSCGGRWDSAFDRAESMMDVCPDSALALLDSIGAEGVSGEADEARYALLRSQALDKCYIDVTDDSLINVAVDYYSTRPDCRHKMLAYYYLAQVYYYSGDLVGSLRAILEAKRLAEKQEDYYYLGMVGYSLAKIYNRAHHAQEELGGAELAIEAFAKTDKTKHLLWAYYYKAFALANMKERMASRKVLDSIAALNLEYKDYALERHCNALYLRLLVYESGNKYNDSVSLYFNKIVNHSIDDYILILRYYTLNNAPDSVDKYLEMARLCKHDMYDQLFIDHHQAKRLNETGYGDSAFYLLEQTLYNMDTLYHSRQAEKLTTLKSDYYNIQAKEEAASKQQERTVWTIVMSCVAFGIVILWLYFREQMRHKKAEMEMNMELINQLRQEIDREHGKRHDSQRVILELFRRQFDTLDELCQTYYRLTSRDDEKVKLYQKIKRLISEFQTKENFAKLEQSINKSYNNVLSRLEECVNVPAREKEVLICTIAGLSTSAIAILLQISASNIYAIKSRLKSRLGHTNPALKDELLSLLG